MEESMKTIDTNTFVNSFKVKPDKSMSFLLGAGASISSNIPSGGQMVWDFKRTLYPEIHIMDTQNLLKSKGRTMVFIEK